MFVEFLGKRGRGALGRGRWLWTLVLAQLAGSGSLGFGESLDAIMARLERNASFRTAYVEGETMITTGSRVATKAFFAYFEGSDKAFIEYVSPARERGVRLLRNADDLRIYLPSAGKVVKIKGGARRRLEANFSFDDVASLTAGLRSQFSAELLGVETLDGRPCHHIGLAAVGAGQTYPVRRLWIDQETAVCLRSQFFTRSGKLAKELSASGIGSFAGRFYPTRLVMTDRLRKGSTTEIRLSRLSFDGPLPPGIFAAGNLAPDAATR